MKRIIFTFLFISSGVFQTFAQDKQETVKELISVGDQKSEEKSYEDAIPYYKRALEKEHNHHRALDQLGICYYKLGDYAKAKEYFRKAILYSENNSYYYSNLGATYSQLGEDEKAYEYARKAYEIARKTLDKDTEFILFNSVSLANNVDKADECLKLLEESTLTKHNDFNTLYGRCYLKKKNYKQAIEKYETYFENDKPDDKLVAAINNTEEKEYLHSAYIYAIGSPEIPDQEKHVYLNRLKKNLEEQGKDKLTDSFFLPDNLCSLYDYSSENCTNTFKFLINRKLSSLEEIQYQYYVVQDYDKAADLSTQLSEKNYKGEELADLKLVKYLSSLQLFSKDYQKNNRIPNLELLANSIALFKNNYEKGRIYTDQEFKNREDLQAPVSYTINLFRKGIYAEPKEQNKMGLQILKILINMPNKNGQIKMQELYNLNDKNR